jgi:hypothetical protein
MDARAHGNEHFRAGRFREAVEAYTRALHLFDRSAGQPAPSADALSAEDGAACLCNRAAAQLQLGQYKEVGPQARCHPLAADARCR